MNRNHDSLLIVAAAIYLILIPAFMPAQEEEAVEPNVLAPGFVMKFERVGGYAGTHDSFWIYPDGRVINGAGRSARISPDIVTEWRQNLASDALKASTQFSMESLCMDCYVYLVTIYDGNGAGTVIASDLRKDASQEGAMAFAGMQDRLLHLVWSPPADTPIQIGEESRPIKRKPIKVGANVQESKLIEKVEPVYPEQAESARLSGEVVLSVTVDEQGLVSDVEMKSGDPILAGSAVAAVKQWRYSPTLLSGEPVPVSFEVRVSFFFMDGHP